MKRSGEQSHAVLIEINSEFSSRPSHFQAKTYPYIFTSNKNSQKQNHEDFFIQLLYVWLHLRTFWPYIYTRNS